MTKNESRKAPRRKHNSVVEIYNESGETIAEIARLVDFSESGAQFSSTKKFAVNSSIRLRLRMMREGRLYIRARVVWVKKSANTNLYGIQFVNVHDVG